ncbi:hypothetical protein BCR39DRAFT_570982 [Naematelia encephala]|uniref:Uncharacterized protein n=1 Tax=Naematelia encephala TaxID=71784 RepID=A0A1Y2ADF4_9TREE|nr:hypothetical protein BCR39DRAFT_570982 [Naematelia encephala]
MYVNEDEVVLDKNYYRTVSNSQTQVLSPTYTTTTTIESTAATMIDISPAPESAGYQPVVTNPVMLAIPSKPSTPENQDHDSSIAEDDPNGTFTCSRDVGQVDGNSVVEPSSLSNTPHQLHIEADIDNESDREHNPTFIHPSNTSVLPNLNEHPNTTMGVQIDDLVSEASELQAQREPDSDTLILPLKGPEEFRKDMNQVQDEATRTSDSVNLALRQTERDEAPLHCSYPHLVQLNLTLNDLFTTNKHINDLLAVLPRNQNLLEPSLLHDLLASVELNNNKNWAKEAEKEKEEEELADGTKLNEYGMKPWPKEYPMFWEGGDPAGLGRW